MAGGVVLGSSTPQGHHNALKGRADPKCHPIQSIDGLSELLAEIVAGTAELSDATPVDVSTTGTGSPGVGTQASRADHVHVVDVSDIDARLDALEYVAPDITSLSNTIGTVEIGSTVSSLTLNWTINKIVATQIFNQGIGSLAVDLRTLALSGQSLTSDTTYELTVGDGANTDSASTSILFRHRRRWGESATETPDSTLIDALAGAEFSTSRAQSRTMSPSAKYLYFAWPAAWGTPTFTVNGLAVTGWVQTTVSYTNPSGNTTSFDVWRSPYPITGTFAVVVT